MKAKYLCGVVWRNGFSVGVTLLREKGRVITRENGSANGLGSANFAIDESLDVREDKSLQLYMLVTFR